MSLIQSLIFAIFLPLLPLQKYSVSEVFLKTYVSQVFELSIKSIDHTKIFLKSENKAALPFLKNIAPLSRYINSIEFYPERFVGPFTGHLAQNLLIGAVLSSDYNPVSRSSILLIGASRTRDISDPYSAYIQIAQGLKIDRITPIPLRTKGLYGIDVIYSGIQPGEGRLWHRILLLMQKDFAKVLFGTGGFAPGPMGSFSYGPSYFHVDPYRLRLGLWNKNKHYIYFSTISFQKGHLPSASAMNYDLKKNQVLPASINLSTQGMLLILKSYVIYKRTLGFSTFLNAAYGLWTAGCVYMATDVNLSLNEVLDLLILLLS